MKTSSKIYTALILLFLFAPIAILLVFSFNESKSLSVFSGFSLYWYKELLRDSETLNAVKNTLLLAFCAAAISTVMGTAAAVGMNKLRNRYVRAVMDTATNIPMKYIYFSQFLTFIILPVSYLLDIVRTALSWNDTAEKED